MEVKIDKCSNSWMCSHCKCWILNKRKKCIICFKGERPELKEKGEKYVK